MTAEPTPTPLDAPVPLRGGECPRSGEKTSAWEDAVPVRIAAERAEAEERKARLRLVLGRRH
jgi:hypothetical protein